MSSGFFDKIVQWEFERNGTRRLLPHFHYDCMSISAIFTASTSRVKKLLPNASLIPVEMIPGRCLVAFTGFEHRRTDIGPYNEVSISFLVTFKRGQIPGITLARMIMTRNFASYIWQLPVTTEHACAGGVDLFGFPKFIADIKFETGGEWIKCKLSKDGQDILCLEGHKLPTKRGKPIRYFSYTFANNIPLVTVSLVNPLEFAVGYSSKDFRLKLGANDPISKSLANIDLSKHHIAYHFIPLNETILFPARNIIED